MRPNEKGFTLMELMVVIVIVAILAAVAVPLYINYVKDAQRTEAKGAIGAVVTAEQTYYQINNKYASLPDPGFIKNPKPGDQNGLNCDLTDALNNWTILVTSADENGFVVEAEGIVGTPAEDLAQKLTFSRLVAPEWDPK
jgi:prepilin-type N-terminal cleavage/methylation domain-containing protein